MFKYVKSLEYPINIKKKDLRMAKYLITQYGGANCNRDFRKDEVMNNYCIHLKRRKNKPFCKFKNEEIPFSCCQECSNKEYKKISANLCKKAQCSVEFSAEKKLKKSTFRSKSPLSTGQSVRKHPQALAKEPQKSTKMKNKSNKLASLERNRYSVFSDDTERCYLCGSTYKLTWHEIYAGRNRPNSMKFGFCLRLCLNCHSEEQESSYFNDYWHKQGQLYWEENIGSREEFIKVFKRNYL